MALDAMIKVKGAKQSDFNGGDSRKGREKTSIVVHSEYTVESPRDSSTGLSTGKRHHCPYKVRCLLDAAYVNYVVALTTNEILTTCKISYFLTAGAAMATAGQTTVSGGESAAAYTVDFTNASVSSVTLHQPYSRAREEEEKNKDIYYDLEITFQAIVWTWVKGGITGGDNWATPT